MPKAMDWKGLTKPKPIDLRLDGLGRLQLSSGTVSKDIYETRVKAIKEAWMLGGVWADAVRGLGKGISLDRFMQAKTLGREAIEALIKNVGSEPLADLMRDYLAQCKNTDLVRMEQKLLGPTQSVLQYLGPNATVADLTTEKVQAFLDQLVDTRTLPRGIERGTPEWKAAIAKKPPTPAEGSTVNRYRSVIQGLSTWACAKGRLAVHPISGKKVLKVAEPHHRIPEMTADEYRDYIALIREEPDLLPLVLILVHTGCDVGELWTLLAMDVELDRRSARLRFPPRGKTEGAVSEENRKARWVPIPPHVAAELRAHIAEHKLRGSMSLFSMIERRRLELLHERAVKAIERAELNLKDLRHIAAISWVKAGINIRTVAKYLGHTSLQMVMRYTDYAPEDEVEADQIARASWTLTKTQDVLPLQRTA